MRRSPLLDRHRAAEAELLTYGPPEAGVELPECFGSIELEYAAIRKHAGLLDQPNRGVLAITGDDRRDFLSRMLTQDLASLAPYGLMRSFWLNRKGRIVADLRVIELDDRTLLDLDVHAAEPTAESLDGYLFSEDCTIVDQTEVLHRLALHGPNGATVLAGVTTHRAGPTLDGLPDGGACVVEFDGAEVIAARDDTAGSPGLELFVPSDRAADLYDRLAAAPRDADAKPPEPPDPSRARPTGWHAFNTARIEAGTPLFNLDFGPDSLPNETAVLRDRVSFDKGCYLGQEIVARIESHGGPKRTLVALRFTSDAAETPQPATGAHLFGAGDAAGDPVGAVTSSTISPMLGAEPIAFAVVRTNLVEPGTELEVFADGGRARAAVQPQLSFLQRD